MDTERGRELLPLERRRIEQGLIDIRDVVIARELASQDQASSDPASVFDRHTTGLTSCWKRS